MTSGASVIVAMSGGVDSSVTAALLKQRGYNVIGATLRMRPSGDDDDISWCLSRDSEDQARKVADVLEIEHHIVDVSDIFEQEILYPAWQEYDRGRTPSPCVRCNVNIKFKCLLELGEKLGASHVATGHYARVIQTKEGTTLFRGLDRTKDQSYFLFGLPQAYLRAALFPLGDMQKLDVRKSAREFGFSNSERKDSQDACFSAGEGGFAEALRIRFNAVSRPGAVMNAASERIGNHQGIHLYTIGQRKGLRIAVGKKAYVFRIDGDKDRVYLTADPKDLERSSLVATGVVWVAGNAPPAPFSCEAQIRYRHAPSKATAHLTENGELQVRFDAPVSAAAPGQAVVLYDGDRVIGGGWIDRTETGADCAEDCVNRAGD